MFGCETKGLPESLLSRVYDRCIRIPMRSEARSLNLSNSVAIVLYEALRQQGFPGLCDHGAWHTAVNGLPLFALYHPAAIIYRRELLSVYEQDVCSLRDSLTIQTQK